MNPSSLTYVSQAVSSATSAAAAVESELERARTLRLSGRPHHAVVAAMSARMRCLDATFLPGIRRVALEAESSLEAGLALLDVGDLEAARVELAHAGEDGGVHLTHASLRDYRQALVEVRELSRRYA